MTLFQFFHLKNEKCVGLSFLRWLLLVAFRPRNATQFRKLDSSTRLTAALFFHSFSKPLINYLNKKKTTINMPCKCRYKQRKTSPTTWFPYIFVLSLLHRFNRDLSISAPVLCELLALWRTTRRARISLTVVINSGGSVNCLHSRFLCCSFVAGSIRGNFSAVDPYVSMTHLCTR